MGMNKTVLITGASGFLGTWVAEVFTRKGYKLIGIDLRAPDKPQLWDRFATSSLESVDLDHLLMDCQLFAVCHLAGGASVASSVNDPFGDFSSLLPGTVRLAIYLMRAQPKARLVLFSSAAVYGNPQQLPIKETTPILPISPYGIHKAGAEFLLENYSRAFGLNVTIFRIFSVYGSGLRKQLIYDVSQRALKASAEGKSEIMLFGTRNESRDFIYVEDLCEATHILLESESKTNFSVYNMASGIESTVADVANNLIRHLNIDIKIKFNGEVPKGDPINWRADITKLFELGFTPKYTIDKGLEKIADWAKME